MKNNIKKYQLKSPKICIIFFSDYNLFVNFICCTKNMIRRLIGFILSVIVAAILFILLIQIFPSRKKSVDIVNMSYVFVDTDWTEYDIFEPVHWSAVDWSFLLEDYIWESDENFDNETWIIEWWHNLNPDNPYNLPEWAIEKPLPKDCETPRWVTIKHKESILAYQQRKDVPDVCNVQRRTCNNWVLDWSFTQPACDETVVYTNWSSSSRSITSESTNVVSYTKKQVVSYNDSPSKNELIQTPKYSKNEWAKYDKNWKLVKGTEQPITNWSNSDPQREEWDYDSKEQKNIKHYNCKTPWWEVVQHGQFVRAYELPFGFTNASCRIELRLCVDWELMWSYTYKECQYLDVTYEEYNHVEEASATAVQHEITNEERHWLWWWIKDLFS